MTYEQLMQEKGGSEAFMQDLTEQREKKKQADIKSGKFFTDELKRDKNDYIYNDPSIKKAYLDMKSKNHNVEVNPRTDLNNFTFDSNTQEMQNQMQEPQPLSPSGEETLAIANNLQQPTRYRNTGIEYFDRLEKPTIGDLFLAKNLGLNMSYNFLDANINANVKKADIGKANNELASLMSDAQTILSGVQHYENTYNNQKNDNLIGSNFFAGLGRKFTDGTNGLINFSNADNEKILSNNKRDVYTLASLMVGGGSRRTNQNIKDASSLIDNTWKGRGHYYAAVSSGIESGLNFMNEKVSYMEAMGIPTLQSTKLKLKLLNDMKKDLQEAQGGEPLSKDYDKRVKALGILNEYGENGINQAVKIIFSK